MRIKIQAVFPGGEEARLAASSLAAAVHQYRTALGQQVRRTR